MLSNAAILGVLFVLVALSLKISHGVYKDMARQSAENLVGTLGVNISSNVRLIDNALSAITLQLNRLEESEASDPAFVSRIASEQTSLIPQLDTIRVTDAQGWILNVETSAPVSVADRDYFVAARADPSRLIISEPFQGRVDQRWGIAIARARIGSDGSFRGLIYSYLPSDHFVNLLDDYALGNEGAVTLRSESLRMIARYSAKAPTSGAGPGAGIGNATVSSELKAALAVNPQKGNFVARTVVDGVERISAYQRVPGYPLLLLVGRATEEFFKPWWREVLRSVVLSLMLSGMLIGLSILLYRKQVQQIKIQRDITRLAAEREVLLESGLVGMAKVKDRVTTWHNNALASMFGYGDRELMGTPTRLLYVDDAAFEQVGHAYVQLVDHGQYRTQLQMRKQDGSLIWIDLSGARLSADESLWMMVDISAAKEAEAQAKIMAMRDPLTGLANRAQLLETMDRMLRNAERKQLTVAVCFIDLDGFKTVNDRFGHDAGDMLLKAVALRMTTCMRANDFVARLGGDEFVVILNEVEGLETIDVAMRRLLDTLSKQIILGPDIEVRIGASIGVAIYPDHGSDCDGLLNLADQAMYAAKRAGKNRFVVVSSAA